MPDTAAPSPERRSPATGLPILSTEPLTAAEREEVRAVIRRYDAAAHELAFLLGFGQPARVDQTLDALQRAAASTDGSALKAALALGRNR